MLNSATLNTSAPTMNHLTSGDTPQFPYQATNDERSRTEVTRDEEPAREPELTLVIRIPDHDASENDDK